MERLWANIEAGRDRIVSLCRDLVRINTVNPYSGDAEPGGERAGQEYLAARLRDLGARVELFDCPADIYQRTGILGPTSGATGRPSSSTGTWIRWA